MEVDKKEIALIEREIKTLPATNPTITSQHELDEAAAVLKRIKEISKTIEARKKEITAPIMAGLASVRDMFRPHEEKLKNTEAVFKSAILLYQNAEEEKAAKERARIEARVEKGTMRPDTAAGKLETIPERPKTAGIQTRKISKVRIFDESLIPREYLVPDMAKITEDVLRQNKEIPGVERYEEKVLASR